MSVRSRLEQAERRDIEEKLDHAAPVRPRSSTTNQAGTGRSQRDKADEQRLKDEVTKPSEHTRSGWTSNNDVVCVRTRDRVRIAKDQAEIDNPAPTPQNAATRVMEAGLSDYHRETAEAAAQRAADIASGKLIVMDAGYEERKWRKKVADEAAARAAEKAAAAERLVQFNITAIMADASANEIAQVKSIIASNYPADKASPERHWAVLQNLRAAIGRT